MGQLQKCEPKSVPNPESAGRLFGVRRGTHLASPSLCINLKFCTRTHGRWSRTQIVDLYKCGMKLSGHKSAAEFIVPVSAVAANKRGANLVVICSPDSATSLYFPLTCASTLIACHSTCSRSKVFSKFSAWQNRKRLWNGKIFRGMKFHDMVGDFCSCVSTHWCICTFLYTRVASRKIVSHASLSSWGLRLA